MAKTAVHYRFMKVLLTVSCALVAFAFGASLDSICNIGGVITNVLLQVALVWSLCTNKQWKRILGFSAAALLLRVSLNPASIDPNFKVEEWFVNSLYFGATAHFFYFSIRPIQSSRKVYLYMGTLLCLGVSALNLLQPAPSRALLLYKLHFGLALLTCLLVLATQEIRARMAEGDEDYFLNAMVMLQIVFAYCFCNAVVLLKKKFKEHH